MYLHMCTLAHIHKGKEQTVSKDIIIIENVFRNTYPLLRFPSTSPSPNSFIKHIKKMTLQRLLTVNIAGFGMKSRFREVLNTFYCRF